MGILNLASAKSCDRGYQYYKENRIFNIENLEDSCYQALALLENYVRKLTREEAQDRLLEVLAVGPDWLEENFIRNYIEL